MPTQAESSGFRERIARVLQALADGGIAGAGSLATPLALERLSQYLTLVDTWNARQDLTAARNTDELVDLFVADAAVLAAADPRANGWVDVGSGAGAPGLPLAILRPELRLTLVEPRTKRVAFLRTVVGTLDLAVEVRRSRSEELPAASFDVAVARATLQPEEWLPEGGRLAREAVWLLLAQAEPPTHPGWRADIDIVYRWPLTGAERRAVRMVRG